MSFHRFDRIDSELTATDDKNPCYPIGSSSGINHTSPLSRCSLLSYLYLPPYQTVCLVCREPATWRVLCFQKHSAAPDFIFLSKLRVILLLLVTSCHFMAEAIIRPNPGSICLID